MPGLDQRGPCGRGAMTGRRQGTCRNGGQTEPAGRFGSGRGCRGRGFGRGSAAPDQFTQAELKDRARALEDELNDVKSRMADMADDN